MLTGFFLILASETLERGKVKAQGEQQMFMHTSSLTTWAHPPPLRPRHGGLKTVVSMKINPRSSFRSDPSAKSAIALM